MKKTAYTLASFLVLIIIACGRAHEAQVTPSAGKVRAPISVAFTVHQTATAGKKISLTITPWEKLDNAVFSLRPDSAYQLISGPHKSEFIGVTDPIQLDFIIHETASPLKSVVLDAEIMVSGQIYRNAHEILITGRNPNTSETPAKGERKIKEL